MQKFLKGKMKRYIGNGTEIKKFYQYLVVNELVNSDYCFEYPFEQKQTYMLTIDTTHKIVGLPVIWLSTDLDYILVVVCNYGVVYGE